MIRDGTPLDLDALCELDPIASVEPARRRTLERALQAGHARVSDDGGRAVGFSIVTPSAFFERDFVELIVVAEPDRRRGIGRALLRDRVDRAPSRIFASTNESNEPMRRLFADEGWTMSGRLIGLDDDDPELVFFRDPPDQPGSGPS